MTVHNPMLLKQACKGEVKTSLTSRHFRLKVAYLCSQLCHTLFIENPKNATKQERTPKAREIFPYFENHADIADPKYFLYSIFEESLIHYLKSVGY